MAEVKATFVLIDRVSNKLDKIANKSKLTEARLKTLGKQLDKINRKLNVTSRHLQAIGLTQAKPSVDLDTRQYKKKAAQVLATQKALDRNLAKSTAAHAARIGARPRPGASQISNVYYGMPGESRAALARAFQGMSPQRQSAHTHSGGPYIPPSNRATRGSRFLSALSGIPMRKGTQSFQMFAGDRTLRGAQRAITRENASTAPFDARMSTGERSGIYGTGGARSRASNFYARDARDRAALARALDARAIDAERRQDLYDKFVPQGKATGAGFAEQHERNRQAREDRDRERKRADRKERRRVAKEGFVLWNRNRRANALSRGGRGGWFHGATLPVPIIASGAGQIATTGIGGLGAGALAGLPMLAGLAGLAGTVGAGAVPLAMQTQEAYSRVSDAQEAVKEAETVEELAEATKELREAQAALTPVQKSLIQDTFRLKDIYKQLFDPLQDNVARMYKTFTDFTELMARITFPTIDEFMGTGERMGQNALGFIQNPREQEMIRKFLEPLPKLAEDTGRALGLMFVWLTRVATAATPLASWMLENISGYFGELVEKTRGNGLDSWVDGFDRFRGVLSGLGGAFVDTLGTFSRIMDDAMPLTEQFIDVFRDRFLPVLESVAGVFAEVAGPDVLEMIDSLLTTIDNLAPPAAKAVSLAAKAIKNLADAFNWLNDVTGGGAAFAVVFGAATLLGASVLLRLLTGIVTKVRFFTDNKSVIAQIFSKAKTPASILNKILGGIVTKLATIGAALGFAVGAGRLGKGKGGPIPIPGRTPKGGGTPKPSGGGGTPMPTGQRGRGFLRGWGPGLAFTGAGLGLDAAGAPSWMSGAAYGAGWGSMFGPWGMAAGAGIGSAWQLQKNIPDIADPSFGENPVDYLFKNPFDMFGDIWGNIRGGSDENLTDAQKANRLKGSMPFSNPGYMQSGAGATVNPTQNNTNNNTFNINANVNATINDEMTPTELANNIAQSISGAIQSMPQIQPSPAERLGG